MTLAVISVAAVSWSGITSAGDRQLSVLFVNMTPDALSDDASKKCVKDVEKVIAADYSEIKRMGETKLRKHAGHPDKSKSFMGWQAKALKKPKEAGGAYHDTVVLIDCRPTEKSIDVLVSPPSDGVSRFKVRSLEVNTKLAKWVGNSILRRAWNGFSP